MFRPTNPHDHHQTEIELREWNRKRDEKKDDFPLIRLNEDDFEFLVKIEKSKDFVFIDEKNKSRATRLRDFDFIVIKKTDSPEKENFSFCEIRTRGKNYLDYVRDEKNREKRQRAHNWRIAIFSAVTGALLSEPLWAIIRAVSSGLKD